jgi:TPR repeat protein
MDAIKLKFEEEQAENGRDLYQYRMGMRYLKGDGVEKDLTKASEYLRKSAAQGNQDAAKALAKSGTQKPTPPATEGGVR